MKAAARKQIGLLTVLLALAAVAGAVVLTPSRSRKPGAWDTLRGRISRRAQVDLFEDFSTGLDAWKSGENIAGTWSYDKNGFVNPGTLALFEPSMHHRSSNLASSDPASSDPASSNPASSDPASSDPVNLDLTNYNVDALVQIESRGLGFAFRAVSQQSYQAAHLLVEGSGPLRWLAMERYTVLSGQASRPARVRYPEQSQADTLYRVHLEVRGDAFSLYIQGHLVDYWSDVRLRTGGVGLFCSPGEHARVAWVRVSHNTDSLGRMCLLLSSVL